MDTTHHTATVRMLSGLTAAAHSRAIEDIDYAAAHHPAHVASISALAADIDRCRAMIDAIAEDMVGLDTDSARQARDMALDLLEHAHSIGTRIDLMLAIDEDY